MKLTLAMLAGIVGLIVTASAVMLIWLVIQQKQKSKVAESQSSEPSSKQEASHEGDGASPLIPVSSLLLKWTYFDYALIGVFAVGSLFLFTDVIAVIRDAESYPLYHYGYLLCGFVFTFMSMLYMILRFASVLSLVRTGSTASVTDEHRHPGQADQAE